MKKAILCLGLLASLLVPTTMQAVDATIYTIDWYYGQQCGSWDYQLNSIELRDIAIYREGLTPIPKKLPGFTFADVNPGAIDSFTVSLDRMMRIDFDPENCFSRPENDLCRSFRRWTEYRNPSDRGHTLAPEVVTGPGAHGFGPLFFTPDYDGLFGRVRDYIKGTDSNGRTRKIYFIQNEYLPDGNHGRTNYKVPQLNIKKLYFDFNY